MGVKDKGDICEGLLEKKATLKFRQRAFNLKIKQKQPNWSKSGN